MQGIKQRTSKLFYQFSLEEHISADHPLRRIDQELDLRFLYSQTRPYYGREGQKSMDPVVFFKICLVGYFHNITSDRALIRYCTDSLSARWFIGYDIDQPLPVHSTLSRTRALFGETIYQQVFIRILALCVDAGLVQGTRQVIDSALVKANAHIGSMQRKQILEDARVYCRQVGRDNTDDELPARSASPPAGSLGAVVPAPAIKGSKSQPRLHNTTHRCRSDPDARMAVKPNKPKDMYYHGQVCVDSQHGVVTAALGDYGDRKDLYSFVELLAKARQNLARFGRSIQEVLADTGYTTGANIGWCEQAGITAYMPTPSNYTPDRPGFTYHEQQDRYECSQGEYLTYRSTTTNGTRKKRIYRTSPSQCATCPIQQLCITSNSSFKQLSHSDGKPWYDRMDRRLRTGYGRHMLRKRKTIVEPALGNLLHHNGMKKVYARGLPAAHKHVLLACMSMNLKKWLKHATNPPRKKPDRLAAHPSNMEVWKGQRIYLDIKHILGQRVPNTIPQRINRPNPSLF